MGKTPKTFVVAALAEAANPARSAAEKAYLKSSLDHLGCGVPATRAAVKSLVKTYPDMGRKEIVTLATALFRSSIYEHRLAAVCLVGARQKLLTSEDVPALLDMVRASKTWALVDELAAHTLGPIVDRDPKLRRAVRRWAKDPDFWVRRTALLVNLVPLRSGKGDFAFFEELAVPMLPEKEFFVRKAIGWILRDTGRKRPELVEGFLDRHGNQCSGLTFREAVKSLSETTRERLTSSRASSPSARRAPPTDASPTRRRR